MDYKLKKSLLSADEGARRPLRLATFAVPLSGNKGSASMLIGLLDGLKAEGFSVEALVFSYYPERDRELARGLTGVEVLPGHPRDLLTLLPLLLLNRLAGRWLPGSWRRTFDRLSACDVICCVGGTTFADSMLYKVPWNIMAALPALLVDRPLAFLSQTMGPFENKWNALGAHWTLRRAKLVHGRGKRSADFVAGLGIQPVDHWPDLSFMMNLDQARQSARLAAWRQRIETVSAKRNGPPVGLTPNTIVNGKMTNAGANYVALMAAIIVDLHERGYAPVLIPHSYRSGDSGSHNNDTGLCSAILEQLPSHVDCLYIDEDLSSQELRLLVGDLRFLVASRFHSMISALAVGVPPLTLGWGRQKYLEVLETFDLGELYLDYAEADLNEVRRRIDLIEADYERIEGQIDQGLRQLLAAGSRLGDALLTGAADGYHEERCAA